MSHNLMMENGRAAMMYVGEVPWHGLGTPLAKPATAAEAIAAAQLDWEVEKLPVFAKSETRNVELPSTFAMLRKDSGDVLGVVGSDYTPLQNREAFGFFDPIVGRDAAIYHTAGGLGRGERIWVLAKLPEAIRVTGDDTVEKFLLLSNSHDGKSSVQIRFTPVRVVCQNTLSLALRGEAGVRVVHHADVHERLREAETTLGIVRNQYDDIAEAFRALRDVRMSQKRMDTYIERVFPIGQAAEEVERARIERDRGSSRVLFESGAGNRLKGVRGTLWAAFNGVTEWIDHRSTRQTRDQRLGSLWFGEGARVKNRAFQTARELAGLWS